MPDEARQEPELVRRLWPVSAAAILIVGAVVRLYHLSLVPLHHDEGVNGNFLLELVHYGQYKYNPTNFHGPTLYYFAAVIPWLSRLLFGESRGDAYGLNDVAIRFVPAVFGIATIWLILILRRNIGSIAAPAGAALLAVSPGAVYLSRYFIHETLLVFFTLGFVVAALRFYETARSRYAMLAAAAAALVFATKETAFISAGVLLVALLSTAIIMRSRKLNESTGLEAIGESVTTQRSLRAAVGRFGGPSSLAIVSIAAVTLFVVVNVLFYSSFFSNHQGILDALKTFQFWTATGKFEHVHPWWTFFQWMGREESPLLLLGAIGLCMALWRRANRLAVFTALWALGLFAAYSMIPYKTPWLMLNFLVPLAIVAGYAFEQIYKQAKAKQSMAGLAIAIAISTAAVGVSGYQMIQLNFHHYDESAYVYPYSHTYRDIFPLLDEIDRLATRAGSGEQTGIEIASPDHWPLPWYLRNYHQTAFYGKLVSFAAPIIIASVNQQPEIEGTFGKEYQFVNSNLNSKGTYRLRPGVDLVIFARKDLVTR